jgi:hypothetical protein
MTTAVAEHALRWGGRGRVGEEEEARGREWQPDTRNCDKLGLHREVTVGGIEFAISRRHIAPGRRRLVMPCQEVVTVAVTTVARRVRPCRLDMGQIRVSHPNLTEDANGAAFAVNPMTLLPDVMPQVSARVPLDRCRTPEQSSTAF